MNTPIVEYEGDQLEIDFSEIDFDLDRPQFSICPKCAAQVIQLSDGCGVCGWNENQKLQGDKLSIPCEIRWQHQQPIEGIIIRDLGEKFDVQINDDPILEDQILTIAKIYVFPKLPSPKKCRTTRDLSPCKKSRRKRGEGSGDIEYKPVKRGLKTYEQLYYHYEIWKDGDRLIKSSKYIPKKLESKIIRMNNEKAPVAKILKVLQNRTKRKR